MTLLSLQTSVLLKFIDSKLLKLESKFICCVYSTVYAPSVPNSYVLTS